MSTREYLISLIDIIAPHSAEMAARIRQIGDEIGVFEDTWDKMQGAGLDKRFS